MTDQSPILRGTSPGWAALLPGLIPAALFVAIHGTRRSYELLQAIIIAASRDNMFPLVTSFDDALLLGLPMPLIAGSLALWVRRHLRQRAGVARLRAQIATKPSTAFPPCRNV